MSRENQGYKTKVLISIDTEFSMGGYFNNKANKTVSAERRIYCKINDKEYGINFIMDILENYGLKGVFFMETESRFYFGEEEIIKIIQGIRSRGHEVQLHVHPNFRTFKNGNRKPDDFRKYSLEEQTSIIQEAVEFLSAHGIDEILAFRSGGFFSDLNTISALKDNDIKFSSNYNLAYGNCDYIGEGTLNNDIFCLGGIFEIPVTCFKEFRLRKEWNSFQVSAASFSEIKRAMNHYHNQKVNVITLITHSFEFVKTNDVQMTEMSPQKFLIRRFEMICDFISQNRDRFEVATFKDLNRLVNTNQIDTDQKEVNFYKSPAIQTVHRYIENYAFAKLNL